MNTHRTPHTASMANPVPGALAATPRDIAGWTLRPGDRVTDHATLRLRGTITATDVEPLEWRPDIGTPKTIPMVTVRWDECSHGWSGPRNGRPCQCSPEHDAAADTLRMIAPGPESRRAGEHARRAGLR
jgi:hypothetical protein